MFFYSKDYLHGPHTLSDADGVETPYTGTPAAHRWLPGDRVDPTSGAVLVRAPKQTFVGIVDFANRTTQGFSPRGVPLYLFHPLQRGAPPCLVAAKTRPAENMFARVAFEHWDGKWPRGGIQAMLGTVGDPAAERAAHIAAATTAAATATATPATTIDALTGTEELPWDIVCNIDPAGCRDVDDVFCLRRQEDGTLVFGIAIADVAAWVPPDSALDAAAAAAGSTFYVDGVPVHPMLPPALSEGAASLLADDQARPTLALVFRIREGAVVETSWHRLALRVTTALTYETATTCAAAGDLVAALRAVCPAWTADAAVDPHKWVEQAMVLYNATAAGVLRGAGQGILRITKGGGLSASEWADLAVRTGIPGLAHMGAAAGHSVAARSTAADGGHGGLGLAHYCHASSPLRRYADLVNQRCLRAILFGGDVSDPGGGSLAHLNWRSRLYKDLERELWFLQHISMHHLTEVCGVVVRSKVLDAETRTLTVYCPAWKRMCKARASTEITPATPVVLTVYFNLRAVRHGDRIVCKALPLFSETSKEGSSGRCNDYASGAGAGAGAAATSV
jgi:hypothetical protein